MAQRLQARDNIYQMPTGKQLQELINKVIRFVKVKQFHSGFPEIASPENGGDITVLIEQDQLDKDIFHINFCFVAIPGENILFRQEKIIHYHELRRLAAEYDAHKDQIEEELAHRQFVSTKVAK